MRGVGWVHQARFTWFDLALRLTLEPTDFCVMACLPREMMVEGVRVELTSAGALRFPGANTRHPHVRLPVRNPYVKQGQEHKVKVKTCL